MHELCNCFFLQKCVCAFYRSGAGIEGFTVRGRLMAITLEKHADFLVCSGFTRDFVGDSHCLTWSAYCCRRRNANTQMDPLGKLNEIMVSIDTETKDIVFLRNISAKTGLRHAHIVLGAGVFMFLFVFLGFGASFFSHFVGFAYPAYASFKAIETRSPDDDKQWLMYWVVFACFAMIESFSDQ
jgi:hypothetical protein